MDSPGISYGDSSALVLRPVKGTWFGFICPNCFMAAHFVKPSLVHEARFGRQFFRESATVFFSPRSTLGKTYLHPVNGERIICQFCLYPQPNPTIALFMLFYRNGNVYLCDLN